VFLKDLSEEEAKTFSSFPFSSSSSSSSFSKFSGFLKAF